MELFNTKSASPISGVFVLHPGEVVVLSAFNLTGQQRAVIQKVRFVESFIPSGSACADVIDVPKAKISTVEDVTQCGVWALNPCQNLAVLSVPGAYRLVLDDGYAVGETQVGEPIKVAESTAVGTAMIEAYRMTVAQAALLPNDLFFGHISQCSGCQ